MSELLQKIVECLVEAFLEVLSDSPNVGSLRSSSDWVDRLSVLIPIQDEELSFDEAHCDSKKRSREREEKRAAPLSSNVSRLPRQSRRNGGVVTMASNCFTGRTKILSRWQSRRIANIRAGFSMVLVAEVRKLGLGTLTKVRYPRLHAESSPRAVNGQLDTRCSLS